MQETTIDFGIDLGTTNSVIAVMNAGQVEVIKNGMSEMTPSCLYINKKGVQQVGAAAMLRLDDEKSTLDVQFEVKRLMGQRANLAFESTGQSMTPEEVSAEVLKELRRATETRFGISPRAAIITIPAMFETPQREATARAAKLAGFEHFQLLQEPVAAAVAHGFRADSDKVFWLVYDFGGGTFDTSIVAIRDGELSVVDHAGDNYLGGSDIDWAIVEQFLLPQLQKEYDLSRLSRKAMNTNPAIRAKMFMLKRQAEELKIKLSRSVEETLVEEEFGLRDESGQAVELDVTMTRSEFNHLIDGMVDQSIQIVEKLLKNSRLTPGDIQKVLLVGGSTFVPRIRERVAALGMSVDYQLDPMTVVARGAAIFAASQRMPEGPSQPAKATIGAHLKLEYNPVSKDLNPLVGGKVTLRNGAKPETGTTIEIGRADKGWTSGLIPIDPSGMFFTNVMVVENVASTFAITIRDRESRDIPVSPNTFTIIHGLSVAKPTLPQSIRLAMYDGTSKLLLQKGSQLPARIEKFRVRTAKALRKGDANDELHIPFVEGEEELALRNRVGGRITISGAQVDRSLPESSELEINAAMDASGISHFHVYVPLLDMQFDVQSEQAEATELKHEPSDVMETRLRAAVKRIQDLEEKTADLEIAGAQEQLEAPEMNERVDAIRRNVAAWKGGDHSAAGRARNLQLELDKELDQITEAVEWPALLVEYRDGLDKARQIVHESGDDKAQSMLSRLEHEGDRAIEDHDVKMLKAAHSAIVSIYMSVLAENPAFWVAMLQNVSEELHLIPDRARANELLKEGMQAVKREDAASLRSIVGELFKMMPREDAERIQAIRSDVS